MFDINLKEQKARPRVHNGQAQHDLSFRHTEEGSEKSPLRLVRVLCQTLEREGIVYCHWKSNAALHRSASGENDIDLLIRRADAQRFTEILHRLGFKQAFVQPQEQLPGVLDFFGYDRDAGRFAHVHAHYQLVLGHDMTKNYRLPIESSFLESSRQGDLFKVPTPEFAFIVFVIRMVLKHSTWDAILRGQGPLSATERQEQSFLQSQLNQAQIHQILKLHLPCLDVTLFDSCVAALQADCPLGTLFQVGRRLQNQLQAHARRARTPELCLRAWRRGVRAIRRRVLGTLPKPRLAHGGAMIAIVGGDGAGKSTAVQELYNWLARDFDTKKFHLGKPPWSWTTFAVRGTLKLARLFTASSHADSTLRNKANTISSVVPSRSQWLRQVCVARDRYRAYLKARRFATNGGIVICDRFPLSEVRLMDGPQLEQRVDASQRNRFTQFLTHRERHCYASILPPDLLIVLKVNPEIAVQRRTEENAARVRARSQEIWNLDWRQSRAHVVDASQSPADVLSELKYLIWSSL